MAKRGRKPGAVSVQENVPNNRKAAAAAAKSFKSKPIALKTKAKKVESCKTTPTKSSKKDAGNRKKNVPEESPAKKNKTKKESEFDFDDEETDEDIVEEIVQNKTKSKGRPAKETKPKKTPVKQTPKNKLEKIKIDLKSTNNKKGEKKKLVEEFQETKTKNQSKKTTKESKVKVKVKGSKSSEDNDTKPGGKKKDAKSIVADIAAPLPLEEDTEEEEWADALMDEDCARKEPALKEAISAATKILDNSFLDDSSSKDDMPLHFHSNNSTPAPSFSSFSQNMLAASSSMIAHQGELHKRLSSSSISLETTATSLKKLQQETMLPKPFNINNQDAFVASALPPPLPPPMYSSTSTGAGPLASPPPPAFNNIATTNSAFASAGYSSKAPMVRPTLDMSHLVHGERALPSSPFVPVSPLGPPLTHPHAHLRGPVPLPGPSPSHHPHHQASASNHHHSHHQQPPLASQQLDSTQGVPPELLAKGWRRCWSRREDRYYYYNKITQQSEWDLPKLMGTLTDSLGVQAAAHPPPPAMPQHYGAPLNAMDGGTPPPPPPASSHFGHGQQAMLTANETNQANVYPILSPLMPPHLATSQNNILGQNANGENRYAGPYDFDIISNCCFYEGPVFSFFHAHPDTEMLRFESVSKIRQAYYDICRARCIETPKDSFTRWLIERKVTDKGWDTLIASECATDMSRMLYNEIMRDVPVKLVKPEYCAQARKQLSKYAEAAKKIISAPHVLLNSRKIVLWNVEEAFEWIRRTTNATLEDYVERLEHLKKQCQAHLNEAAKQVVDGICIRIYQLSLDYSKRVRELNAEIFKKEAIQERFKIQFPRQKTPCYPAYLINPCPKLPAVQYFPDHNKDIVFLRYKMTEPVKIDRCYWTKLERLYQVGCRDDQKYSLFLQRAWCLLKRYQAFFTQADGLSLQESLPLSVFVALNKHFGVTFECFSSPLNCFFRQYCSLFPDTDGYFGSIGPILNFYPCTGSFQAFPPDCEDLVEASIIHFEKLLENTIEPMSFVLFIQEWPQTSQRIMTRLDSNRFKREQLKIGANKYELRHGLHHLYPMTEPNVYHKSSFAMVVYFLQNDAGFLKWGPTPERMEQLAEAFEIGRDKELLLRSPPPTPTANTKMDANDLRSNLEGDTKETI